MNYPTKGALIRALRTVAALTASALVTSIIAQTPIALEGTPFLVFAGGLTTAILAADKYIREKTGLPAEEPANPAVGS
jgi:hypothetical protein